MESEFQDVILKSHLICNNQSIFVFIHNIWLFFINYICNTVVIFCLHKKKSKNIFVNVRKHMEKRRREILMIHHKTKHLVAMKHWSSIFWVIDNVICGRSDGSSSAVWILEWTEKWKTASETRLEFLTLVRFLFIIQAYCRFVICTFSKLSLHTYRRL